MKKTNKKTTKKATVGQQYEDYVQMKQMEQQKMQQEVSMMEAMMDQESPHYHYGSTFPAEVPVPPPAFQNASLAEESPPLGNVKALKAKKAPAKARPTAVAREGEYTTGRIVGDYNPPSSIRHTGMGIGGNYRSNYSNKFSAPPNYMEPAVRTEMEDCDVLPELESSEAKLPSDIEQFDDVRTGLRIIRQAERTLVYCIVVDKQNEKNVIAGLRCYGGVAFGGYARDVSGDAYLVECVQSVHLGTVPFSFRLEMPKAGNWNVDIPIPEKVLEAAFAPAQRKTLSDLRDRFPEDRYEFQYLQMLMAN